MFKFFVITEEETVLGFKSKARARGMMRALDYAMFFHAEDMSRLPTDWILQQYNRRHPDCPIEKFPTRADAMSWIQGILPAIAIPGEKSPPVQGPAKHSPSSEVLTMAKAKAAKKAAKKVAAKKSTSAEGRAGRRSQYSGMKITKLESKNPRKEGTSGHASFAAIKNGMTYEQYIEAGGVRRDLEWDIAHKWVKLGKA